MVKSQKAKEGYLLVSNEHASPDPALPPRMCSPVFETATQTCSHCQAIVIQNPQRTRARPYCPKCDHYVCDACEAVRVASGGQCRPFTKLLDQAEERLARGQPIGDLIHG